MEVKVYDVDMTSLSESQKEVLNKNVNDKLHMFKYGNEYRFLIRKSSGKIGAFKTWNLPALTIVGIEDFDLENSNILYVELEKVNYLKYTLTIAYFTTL